LAKHKTVLLLLHLDHQPIRGGLLGAREVSK